MTRKAAVVVIGSTLWIAIAVGLPLYAAVAQPATSAPATTTAPATADLGSRVAAIETEMARIDATQAQHVEALHSTIDQIRFVVTWLSVLLTAIVAIQAFFQFRQQQVQHAGVEEVSKVMGVITQTLESRLKAEEEARGEKEALEELIRAIQGKMEGLLQFRTNFAEIIRKQGQEIEANAEALAATSRHDFRARGQQLTAFARQFDVFKEQYQPIEAIELSAKAHYIRGVAAHYANDPEKVRSCLQKVVQTPAEQSDRYYDRRTGNAYYFLGITESNFLDDPAASFRAALSHENTLEDKKRDFLTRVVAAQSLAMSGSTEAARTQAEETVNLIDRSYAPGIMLPFFHQRLRSRAVLVQANAEILEGKANYWERVQGLLEPVLRDDPRYYYAIVTIAQAYTGGGQPKDAKDLFQRAYHTIQTSNDVLVVTEVRSEALLRMTAGLCCMQTEDLPSAEEHLEKTSQLLDMLPSMDSARCSVFSVLSKKNESMDVISLQLDWIRNGLTAPP